MARANPLPGAADGQLLEALESGPKRRFWDWPPADLPVGQPGIYTIWRGDEFIYVGISYRAAAETASPRAKGVFGRLATHASGQRSGDKFNIYICDRFVIPTLDQDELQALSQGELNLDQRTRQYIRDHLTYRVELTATGDEARRLETGVQRFGLPTRGHPLLNPKPGPRTGSG